MLDDHFLLKQGTSQLALLSDGDYAAGRGRVEASVAEGERAGTPARFAVDITLAMAVGRA
ncbi:MAG TPA: hypothetical protein VG389_00945 [Myxococcota bacterium]|jgi:hypothetical protein|nr:hypothetical protein [Myxococcota bacterium]